MSGVMREVRVRPVLNGFVVEVGCQTLVFNNIESVANALVEYQTDPDGTEKLYRKNAVNNTLGNTGEYPAPPPEYRGGLVERHPLGGLRQRAGETCENQAVEEVR